MSTLTLSSVLFTDVMLAVHAQNQRAVRSLVSQAREMLAMGWAPPVGWTLPRFVAYLDVVGAPAGV